MINSIFWNIRGIRKKIACSRLKILKNQYNLNLIGICEPLIDASCIPEFKLKLGFSNCIDTDESNIWVFFDDNLSGKIFAQSDQHLSILFSLQNNGGCFIGSLILASCSKGD